MQQSAIIQGVDTLHGVVPKEWLRRDRMVIDNSKVAVAIYHRPSVMGHLVVFPKAHCARLEDADPEVFSALGMMLPVVKRAIRLCTGYRSCGIVLQSGDQTGQAVPHLYFEVVPSGKTSRNFQFEWDPNGDWDAGRERNVTKLQAATLLRAVRSKLSLRSTEPLNNVLWDTGLITAELVQRPSSIGHFMVSPKELSPDLEDCARLDCGACLWVVPKIAQAMVQTMRTKDFVICLLNGPESGQLFPHLTFQVVPFSNRKVAVTFDTVAKVHMSEDQSFALCNALRQVIGEDQLSTAMRMEVAPLESAWDRPPSRPSVSRAGVSSPYVDRGRAPPATIEDWAVARVPTEDVDPQRLARRASGNSGLTMRAAGGDPRGVFAQHRPPGIGGGGGGPLHGGAQRMLSSAGSAGSARSARSGTFGEWSRGLTRDEAARTVLEQARALLRD